MTDTVSNAILDAFALTAQELMADNANQLAECIQAQVEATGCTEDEAVALITEDFMSSFVAGLSGLEIPVTVTIGGAQ